MNLKTTTAVIATIFITGCASNTNKRSAHVQESVTSLLPGGALLIGFNRNDDYVIDEAELTEGRESAFKKADLDGNGIISLSEFRFWQPKATGSRSALPNLVYFDRNFNDRISHSEFDVGLKKLFDDADENKDSKVSYQELVSIVSPPESRKGKSSSGGRGGGSERGKRGGSTNF
jgi:hypothetical protein